MSLFTDNFPLVKTDKELDDLKIKYPKYDHYYIASGSIEDRKKFFETLYSEYQPYADSHFLQELKINFHQRSWEMYLACVLLENGFEVTSDDEGPDIKLVVGDKTIWIECVAPTQGRGQDRVPDTLYGVIQGLPEKEMILRLASALKDKFYKYKKYLNKKIVSKNDIFIIAVNSGVLGYPDTALPLIFKCLYSLGDLTLPIIDGKLGKSYYTRRENLNKKSGNPVPMNFFKDQQYEGISAVIYSKATILNHPEKIGTECILIHNPLAKNRLSKNLFSFFMQYKATSNQIIKI